MKNSRTDIDRLFEKGLSDVTRAPRKTFSEEQIKAAAAASKSGAGIWLLSHAREMLIGVVSFITGCLVTFAVLHYTAPKPSESQVSADIADIADVTVVDNDIDNNIDLGHDLNQQGQNEQTSQLQNSSSHVTRHTSNVSNPKSHVSTPVVVKKTVVQRDTVVIKETVTLKDTVYLKDN